MCPRVIILPNAAFTVLWRGGKWPVGVMFFFASMSPSPHTLPIASWQDAPCLVFLAQSAVESAHIKEIERLRNGGRHDDHSGDFALFVVLPLCILLGIVVLGRRMMS